MSAAPVAAISETMARFFLARQDAVGKRFRPTGEQGYLIKIIGVTKDAKVGTREISASYGISLISRTRDSSG
jgi:hypothetical protein